MSYSKFGSIDRELQYLESIDIKNLNTKRLLSLFKIHRKALHYFDNYKPDDGIYNYTEYKEEDIKMIKKYKKLQSLLNKIKMELNKREHIIVVQKKVTK